MRNLSRIDAGVSIEIMSNSELLMNLLMDSTSLGVLKVRQVDDNPRGVWGGGGGTSDIFIHVYFVCLI